MGLSRSMYPSTTPHKFSAEAMGSTTALSSSSFPPVRPVDTADDDAAKYTTRKRGDLMCRQFGAGERNTLYRPPSKKSDDKSLSLKFIQASHISALHVSV